MAQRKPHLRLDVLPDDAFRADLLALCIDQVLPVVRDELGAGVRARINEILDKSITEAAVLDATKRAVDKPEFRAAMRPIIDEQLRVWLAEGVGDIMRRETLEVARETARKVAQQEISAAFARLTGR